jgi:hypothetical protein
VIAVSFVNRPNFADFKEMINILSPLSQTLLSDIVYELSKKGLKKVGNCHRVNKKYFRWLMEEIPALKRYSECWGIW